MNTNFQISLDIPDVEILKIEKNKTEDLIITVRSTKCSTACHKCGKEAKKSNGYGETIILQHLPILGQRVYIRIKLSRYECEYCDDKPTTTEEQTSWFNRRSKFTKAYEEYLMRSLINSTLLDVSRKEGVSYDDVEGVLSRQVEKQVNWGELNKINIIGLDEISLKKGHKNFVVIVSAKINGVIKILAILPDRKKETIKAFIQGIPDHLKKTIKTVCCDMYEGYINAMKEICGNKVKVVIDRFHVAKNYRKCLESMRKKELKRLKRELTEAEYKKLKGAMWALRNSGFIEGLNNKIKVIKRRCYGIFNSEKLFQRIFLDLEGYERFA